MSGKPVTLKLRYDGKYDFMPADVARQWTIISHFIDVNGCDRFKGSFSLQGLKDIGAVPTARGILTGGNSNQGAK